MVSTIDEHEKINDTYPEVEPQAMFEREINIKSIQGIV